MTIRGYGFDGSIDELSWSWIAGLMGTDSAFAGRTDFQPTANTGVTRGVNIAPGRSGAAGVAATSDLVETLTLDAAATGSRWDLVVLRRDWSTNTVSLVKILGPSSGAKTFPAIQETPGEIFDQPVAWCLVTAGSTIVTVEDLRIYSSPVLTVPHYNQVRKPHLGQECVMPNGMRFRYELVGGVAQWRGDRSVYSPADIRVIPSADILTSVPNWSIASPMLNEIAVITGNFVELTFSARLTSGSIPFSGGIGIGNINDVQLGLLKPAFVPRRAIRFYLNYTYSSSASDTSFAVAEGGGAINTTGNIALTNGQPNTTLYPRKSPFTEDTWSVKIRIQYMLKTPIAV